MHEPSDVTIELDGVGRQLSELPAGDRPPPEPGSAQESALEGTDGPVFVDASGRRSKRFRRAGWIVAIACACYAVTLVVAVIGGSSRVPLLNIPIPGVHESPPADSVKPGPSTSATTGATPGAPQPGQPQPTDSNGSPIPQLPGSTPSGKAGTPSTGASTPVKEPKPTKSGGIVPNPGTTPSVPAGDPTGDPVTPPVDPASPPPDDPGTVPPPEDPATPPPDDPVTPPADPPPAQEGSQNLAVEGAQ
jgi:hypothetical protein